MQEYVCKVANQEEMQQKWEYEIARAKQDRANWKIWKARAMERAAAGKAIPYYGILDGRVICEATASISADTVQNAEGLIDEKTAYLCAFRTVEEHQGKGYFSQLFRFLLADLAQRGYEAVTLGVEPEETENKAIYAHYGFDEYIKSDVEAYPDGTVIDVEYYRKKL